MANRHRTLASPSWVTSAAAAVVVHGALLTAGSYQRTYDAYVHIFFADHYARDWFSTWETRWYTGFTTISYPPGTHQLIGLLSGSTGLLGAFVIVQLAAVVALVVGVYRYARLWVSDDAARWAAMLAVVSSAIAEAVHVFGQLPTTFSLALLLHAMPSLHRWMADGRRRSLLVGVATMAATTAGHHVTTLFGSVFFLGPVVARVLIDALRRPAPGETGHLRVEGLSGLRLLVLRRLNRVTPTALRVATTGFVLLTTLALVVLPYWIWSATDPISQVPIPHDSRASFLANPNAGLVFWVIPWGTLLLLLPAAVGRAAKATTWPLAMSVGLLFVLGTGGTTPVPRLLLGGAFDVLTLDRFTFWATIAVLPLVGAQIETFAETARQSRVQAASLGAFAIATIGMFLFAANLSHYRTLQPDPIDPQPIAEFLAKDDHSRWRYLPLGFGDQMAWVSAHTEATTVDGNYHSARRLPELVSRPVERLEGAKFRGMPGIGSLQQFVTTPERYNLKFVLSNDTFYDPLLFANGWHELGRLRNGVVVWERADVSPLPPVLPERQAPAWQRLLWGTVPLGAIAAAGALQVWSAAGEPLPAFASRRLPTAGAFDGVRPGARSLAGVDLSRPAVPLAWRFSDGPLHDCLWRLKPIARVASYVVAGTLAIVALAGFDADGSAPVENQVYDYYDDIDFARFEDAWQRLDPLTRATFDAFLFERSAGDGLVSSYAKLDRLDVGEAQVNGNRAEVDVRLRYITAVEAFEVETSHELVARNGQWYLVPEPFEDQAPEEQFVRRTTVDYLDMGRRTLRQATAYGDVLDRPRIEVLDSRLVRRNGQLFVVGQLTNVDIDPADITVTGRLLGSSGEELASYHAGSGTIHKVLPGETVPFRIGFEGVAGEADGRPQEFEPGRVDELTLSAPVASYELSAQALVTGRDLSRLELRRVRATSTADGLVVSGEVRNDNFEAATVPIAHVSLLDASGEVVWVEPHFLAEGIRPQRRSQFDFRLIDRADVVIVADVPGVVYDNGRDDQIDERFAPSPTLVLPADSGFDSVRIQFRAFERGAST